MSDRPPLRSFGRIKARALKPSQERLVVELLPKLALDLSQPIVAGPKRPLALEIGFGGGEHLAAQAKAHPDLDFIGVEPFLNGVGSCLRHLDEGGLDNVRLHMGDVREVLPLMPGGALARVWILFPDPWPKARHWKRRLIQQAFLEDLARVMAPGAQVRFATDWAHYAAWTLEAFAKSRDFAWTAGRAADWRAPFPDHVTTRYEAKRLGDCRPVYLSFERRNSL